MGLYGVAPLAGTAVGLYNPVISLGMEEAGFSDTVIGAASSLFFLDVVIVAPMAGYVARRQSLRAVLAIGLALARVGATPFPMAQSLDIWILFRLSLPQGCRAMATSLRYQEAYQLCIIMLSFSLLTRRVEDADIGLRALTPSEQELGNLPPEVRNHPAPEGERLKLAFWDDFDGVPLCSRTRQALYRAVTELARAGHTTERKRLDGFDFKSVLTSF